MKGFIELNVRNNTRKVFTGHTYHKMLVAISHIVFIDNGDEQGKPVALVWLSFSDTPMFTSELYQEILDLIKAAQ